MTFSLPQPTEDGETDEESRLVRWRPTVAFALKLTPMSAQYFFFSLVVPSFSLHNHLFTQSRRMSGRKRPALPLEDVLELYRQSCELSSIEPLPALVEALEKGSQGDTENVQNLRLYGMSDTELVEVVRTAVRASVPFPCHYIGVPELDVPQTLAIADVIFNTPIVRSLEVDRKCLRSSGGAHTA